MKDIYQGDPKIYITEDGADFIVKGGQPDMEQGVDNNFNISLFTAPGWPGNFYIKEDADKYGSDFEETAKGTITLNKLNDIRQSGISALSSDLYGEIDSEVTNPSGDSIKDVISINPPTADARELVLTKNGVNWIKQAEKGTS
jgi:hypothetical protein